jgi:hypothetical protein
LLAGVGCDRSKDVAADAGEWRDLLNGPQAEGWLVVQGRTRPGDEGLVLQTGEHPRTTVLHPGLSFRDGWLEVIFRRLAPQPKNAPCTVGVRLHGGLNWEALYIVCRRGFVEAVRGSAADRFPTDGLKKPLAPGGEPEVWRVFLQGPTVEVFRDGNRVLNFRDPDPARGMVAVTAEAGEVEILSVRFRSIEPPGPVER